MAGRGPAPKDPEKRARRDQHTTTTLVFEPADQPALPELMPDDEPWPERTVAWWAMWGESPQATARLFSSSDWSELMDTALLHARLWKGQVSVAPELRLRVAKFGATMEDRARLRIQFANADQADAKRPPAPVSSRERYGKLEAVPDAVAAS